MNRLKDDLQNAKAAAGDATNKLSQALEDIKQLEVEI